MARLIGSHSTLDGLIQLICKRWTWDGITLITDTKSTVPRWIVFNERGDEVTDIHIIFSRGRFRLEALNG